MSSLTEKGDSVPESLPGFRFFPSEEILVSYYLTNKNQGNDSKFRDFIPEIEVCKHEPFEIPAFFDEPDVPDHDREWFFFTRPVRKSINSTRCNRTTDKGYYSITGDAREITTRQSKAVIGKRKILAFYLGRQPKGTKTDWVIHEYSLPNPKQQTDFVLCRLKKKSANYKKRKYDSICNELAEPGTGGYIAPNSEDDQTAAADDRIPDPVESTVYKEPEHVLLGSHNQDECAESPNGSCLIENSNIPTSDDNEPSEWNRCFGNQTLGEVLEKMLVQPAEVRDSPFPPPQPSQAHLPPQPKDCCSSELRSSSWTNLVNVPRVYNDDCSKRQSEIVDNNYISTNDHNGAVSKIAHDAHSRATDEIISEDYIQLEDLRSSDGPFWHQDYALQSPMNTELGDVGHANKYIGCIDELRSPDLEYLDITTLFPPSF